MERTKQQQATSYLASKMMSYSPCLRTFCWHGKAGLHCLLVHLEGRVTSNQYKVVLSDQLSWKRARNAWGSRTTRDTESLCWIWRWLCNLCLASGNSVYFPEFKKSSPGLTNPKFMIFVMIVLGLYYTQLFTAADAAHPAVWLHNIGTVCFFFFFFFLSSDPSQ